MRLGPVQLNPRKGQSQLGLELSTDTRSLPVLDQRNRRVRFHSLTVRQVLNSPVTTGMGFWSLNPYIGCEFGCTYCYARKTHEWAVDRNSRQLNAQGAESPWSAFEHEILAKTGAPEVLLRTLDPAKLKGELLVIGTATDPYQPAERTLLVTRRVLEALLRFQDLKLGIITKSPLVTRDLDLLTRIAKRHDLTVNISIASMDAGLLRTLEARSPAPHARIRALARLTRAGIRAGVMIAPIIPGITDRWASLAAVMEAARGAGAKFAHGFPLRLGPAARKGFLPVLERKFPELVERYRRQYGPKLNAGKAYQAALKRRLQSLREAFGLSV